MIERIYGIFLSRSWLGYAVVFSLTLAIYAATQAHPSFIDPDSFYHAKMAQLTLEQGPVRDFLWLPFTTLADDFADHHFLYHVALIPFVTLWGPLAGIKAAAAIFGASAVTAAYWLMRTLRVRYSCVFALLLATLDNFMFRINLAKTSSLSMLILMLGIIAMMKRRPWLLAPLAFVYVWTYAGWPLLPVIAAAFLTSAGIVRLIERRHGARLIRPVGDPVHVGATAFVAVAIGSLAGLVINPFFPANLKFYLAQIGHIAMRNYSGVIDVGVEWYPFPFLELVGQNATLFLITALIVILAACAVVWAKEAGSRLKPFGRCEAAAIVLFPLLAAAFLVLTLKSRRNVEYFIPFMMLADAVVFTAVIRRTDFRALQQAVLGRFLVLPKLLTVLLFIIVPLLAVRDANAVIALYRGGTSWSYLEKVTAWMDGRVPDGETVFHSRWSDFPALFYRAPEYRYISGLDPTFLYLADPGLQAALAEMARGDYGDKTGDAIRERFGSDFILIRSEGDEALETALDSDHTVQRVYEDDEVIMYVSL